jgi:DNA polymerase III subunit chi
MHIEFHLLPEATLELSLRRVCALIEKAYLQGKKIYIHTPDPSTHQPLDDLLWTFHDTSFLPHEIYKKEFNTPNIPILIGSLTNPPSTYDLLCNLTKVVPDHYRQFQEIIEVVPDEPALRAAGRSRYKFYKEQGHELEVHQ